MGPTHCSELPHLDVRTTVQPPVGFSLLFLANKLDFKETETSQSVCRFPEHLPFYRHAPSPGCHPSMGG